MLQDYWYIACEARAVRRKPVAIRLFDQPIVIFRDAQGRPAALQDRCAHRGAPLSKGRLCDGTLECPYHGWRYDAGGQVVSIPARPDIPPECVQGTLVPSYACLEQDGYIWISLAQRPAQSAPLRFPYIDQPGWTSFRMNTYFPAPVEACLENFLDCPHATFVHRFWFRAPTAKPVRAVTRSLSDGAVTEYYEEPREKSLVWSLLAPRAGMSMQHTDRFIAPATSRVDYLFSNGRHYVITSSCTPLSAQETRVHTVISFRFGRIGKLIRLFFQPLSRYIIRQDVKILKLQQDNIRRFTDGAFQVIEQDVLIRHIRAWRQALRSGAPPPPAGREEHVKLQL